jgi:deoxyribose-phosphate aldolase
MDFNTLKPSELARYIQYTNVKPDATRQDIITHLERAVRYGFQAAMIPMCWVRLAKEALRGTNIHVATYIGLGFGQESLHAKIALIRECRALGADEVDYEPNMAFFMSAMYDEFKEEAIQIVKAAEGMPVKAMLELGYIQADQDRRLAARLLDEAGVPWVKNSSGWGPGSEPASPENIRLLCESTHNARVKASGKINSYEKAIALLEAGAELLGTSSAPEIVERVMGEEGGY